MQMNHMEQLNDQDNTDIRDPPGNSNYHPISKGNSNRSIDSRDIVCDSLGSIDINDHSRNLYQSSRIGEERYQLGSINKQLGSINKHLGRNSIKRKKGKTNGRTYRDSTTIHPGKA